MFIFVGISTSLEVFLGAIFVHSVSSDGGIFGVRHYHESGGTPVRFLGHFDSEFSLAFLLFLLRFSRFVPQNIHSFLLDLQS